MTAVHEIMSMTPVTVGHHDHLALVGMVSRGDVLRGLRFQLVEGSYVK
jgi:predicted transcriptional regulator